jgi:hypothetical protein
VRLTEDVHAGFLHPRPVSLEQIQVCGSGEVGRPSAVMVDLVQADRSMLQNAADEAGFHLFFESPLKRKRPAWGIVLNIAVRGGDAKMKAYDTAVLYSCIRIRRARRPRHHACMKLLLHGMRMLAARACMVAARSIRTSTDVKNRSNVSTMEVRKHHLLVGLCAILPSTGHSVDLNHLEGPPPTSSKVHFGPFWILAGLPYKFKKPYGGIVRY